ncbi:MAG: prepilin-type N-terminal cleavage/methylation domain-containing protein [Chthonomonadales bacterium]
MKRMKLRAAFTVIEMLVVVAVLGILLGLVVPAVVAARENGRIAGCQSNLRQRGQAMALYMSDYDGIYPFGLDPYEWQSGHEDGGHKKGPKYRDRFLAMADLRDLLLPYGASLELWRCPSDRPGAGESVSTYVAAGTSYWYGYWLPALGAGEGFFPDPAGNIVMGEYGAHRGTNLFDWMKNELFADYHVKLMPYVTEWERDYAERYVQGN